MKCLNRFLMSTNLLLSAALFASPVAAQIAFIKTIGTIAPSNNGTSTTVKVPAAGVAEGNSVILSLAMNPVAGAVSCSDTRGNPYSADRDVTNGSGNSGVRTIVLSTHNIIALTSGSTISCTHPRVSARALSANEFSGLAASATADQAFSAVGTSITPSSDSTPMTSQAAELLIGAIGVEGPTAETFTAGAGYATIGRAGTSGGNPANNITINPEYLIVSATGVYAATGTLSASRLWAAGIVTYKAAPPLATNLVITSVNDGGNPDAGVGFPVIVQSQTASGTPANVSSATGISLSLRTGTGALGGTLTGTIAAGTNQITITEVTYTKAENGVVITATRTGGNALSAGDSAAFTVNPGAATTLVFTTQPGNATAGSAISGPPTVTVQDYFGNAVISSTAPITVAIGTNPSGGILTGTIPKSASAGFASFSDLSIDKAGTGYTLLASATGLTNATSSTFNIGAGAAAQIVFTTQPGNATAGTAIPGPTTATVQDSFGNTVTSSIATITMAIGTNPGSGTLSGTTARSATGGIASFSNLTIDKAGTGYTLTASTSGLTGATSNTFNVTAGAAAALAFTTQPGNAIVGSNISGPPTVAVRDSFGNTVTSSMASITIGIGANPGGGSLSGTATKDAASGVASFGNLSINQAGTGYSLTAVATGLTGATSSAFNITAAAGVSLTAIPSSVPAGDPFIVTWAQIPNPSYKDWIGLFTPGSSDTAYLDYLYAGCTQSPTVPAASGVCSFPISSSRAAGPYEFRLFPNDTVDRLATSNPVTIGPPSNQNKLAISVGPTVPAGTPGFSVTVQSQTPSGVPVNVISNTAVTVSLMVGNGMLGGTLSGTITSGTNLAMIGPVTYSKAETGVVLTASRTSGDDLRAQNSLPFTVIPGPAAQLAFTTQPSNATVGSTIPGPPTVTVQDNAGNAVTSTTATISISLGANPGSATLDDNLTVTFGSSVSFPALIINQPGSDYALIASSTGLQSATSNPFNVTLPGGGGTIAGVITRVSNGTTISGALVEAYQSDALRGTAVTNATGNYSITGLAAGSYTVRASFTGLVPQMVNNVSVVNGSTTPVELSLNFGIAVQSPVAGATVNDFSVLVTGLFDTSLASEVGIKVNGYISLIDGNEFATMVPIDSQTTTVTATMTDAAGNVLAGDAVPITPQPPTTEPVLTLRVFPAIALAAQPVSFTLTSLTEFSQIELDGNGDGTLDFTGTTLEGVSVTFAESGLYYPNITVTEVGGVQRTVTSVIQVLDMVQLDGLLQSKWTTMKNALRNGNTVSAASFIMNAKRATYQNVFNNLTIPFANIDQVLGNITYVEQRGVNVEYKMIRIEGGIQVAYMVLFVIDEDGVWRIKFF